MLILFKTRISKAYKQERFFAAKNCLKTKLARKGARVFGVSPDPVKSHKKFADKHTLKFTLLADLDHKLAERMGVWQEKQFMGRRFMGVVRSTFVFQKGKLLRLYPNVRVAGHADAVLEDL